MPTVKSLQSWLDEMDKLDRDATAGVWQGDLIGDGQEIWTSSPEEGPSVIGVIHRDNDAELVKRARTELPRAVKVIKKLLENCKSCETKPCCPDRAIDMLADIHRILNEG